MQSTGVYWIPVYDLLEQADQIARPAARDGKPNPRTSKTLNSETHANHMLLQILAQSPKYSAVNILNYV